MNERFCKNDDGDCPCLETPPTSPNKAWMSCSLLPQWEVITNPETHYCYSGRQIMEQQATWKALKNCYPHEVEENQERKGESYEVKNGNTFEKTNYRAKGT